MNRLVWKGDDGDASTTLADSDEEDEMDDDEEDSDDEEEAAAVRPVKTAKAKKDAGSFAVLYSDRSEQSGGAASTEIFRKVVGTQGNASKSKSKASTGGAGTEERTGVREEMAQLRDQLQSDNTNITPLSGESLRVFYGRTAAYWSTEAIAKASTEHPLSEKEIKREGFKLAEERYNAILPLITRLNELETQQQEYEEEEDEDDPRRGHSKKSSSSKKSAR